MPFLSVQGLEHEELKQFQSHLKEELCRPYIPSCSLVVGNCPNLSMLMVICARIIHSYPHTFAHLIHLRTS
jgi:hypothetical protein